MTLLQKVRHHVFLKHSVHDSIIGRARSTSPIPSPGPENSSPSPSTIHHWKHEHKSDTRETDGHRQTDSKPGRNVAMRVRVTLCGILLLCGVL